MLRYAVKLYQTTFSKVPGRIQYHSMPVFLWPIHFHHDAPCSACVKIDIDQSIRMDCSIRRHMSTDKYPAMLP